MLRSSRFWGYMYIFMGIGFVYLAINQSNQAGWGLFTMALIAIAAYDFMIGMKYLFGKPKKADEKKD